MLYIEKKFRPRIDKVVKQLFHKDEKKMDAGELNYTITQIVWKWMHQDGKAPKYLGFCIVMGTLICVMLELYRRKAAPYEDCKIMANGDAYGKETHD